MVEEKKKANILLALLFSMLTALAGGILFGIVYGIGYYIYLLALGEIVLAAGVYLKFAQKHNWQNVTIAIIWCVIWTFIFNLLAIVVCEALFVAKDFGVSFADAYKTVIELWKTDAEVKAYMNKRIFEIAGMIILGGIVYGIYFVVNISKAKKARKQNEQVAQQNAINQQATQPSEGSDKSNTEQIYLTLFNECKTAITNYAKSKDQEIFKQEVKEIKAKHITDLDNDTKQEIIAMANRELTKQDLSNLAKKTNETLLKIVK